MNSKVGQNFSIDFTVQRNENVSPLNGFLLGKFQCLHIFAIPLQDLTSFHPQKTINFYMINNPAVTGNGATASASAKCSAQKLRI